MWWKKKKVEPEIPVEPKETTRNEVMEIVLVNNKTDKEYRVKSNNDFGLKWEYIGDKGIRYELLVIQQKKNIKGTSWEAKGRFSDFSIVELIWQTFDIPEETKLKEDEKENNL